MRKKVVLNNGDIAVITPASVESAGELVGYMNLIGGESDNFTFGLNEFGVSVEHQTELISNMKPTSLTQIFIAKVDGEIVSQGEITFCNRARTMHTCSLAISVRQDKWGVGLGSEMMKYLIEYIKSKRFVKIIFLEVRADNWQAIGLYEKYGFIPTGQKENILCVEGEFFDTTLMQLYL
ncbi:MAG: N-acetyltransferase [Oscillospiraceae bacterium]